MTTEDESGSVRWLDEPEARAWYAYRRMSLLLNAQVNKELAAQSGLSEPDYDVLSALSSATDRRARVSDLAAHMLWSRSRLSHHIARMETRGLVTREGFAEDGRGAVVVLVEAGRSAIEAAAPGHVESVRRHVFDRLTPTEVEALAEICRKIIDALVEPDPPKPS